MSSSITTRVGWGAQSTFGEGPSSGPGVVLDRRLRVEEGRRMRLKGSRHKCSGSGGLERKQEDQRGSGGLLAYRPTRHAHLVCEGHVASWGGEAGGWLRTESCRLLRCCVVGVSSWDTRGT